MMKTINPYLKQYQKNDVETATPEKLLILLYNGAIQYLNKAKIFMEKSDYEKSNNNLIACQKIIREFMATLNMEMGGDVAKNLYNLYEYLHKTLVSANISHDPDKIDEVLKHLMNLRDTWQKAIAIANSERSVMLHDSVDKRGESHEYHDMDDEDLDGYEHDDENEDE